MESKCEFELSTLLVLFDNREVQLGPSQFALLTLTLLHLRFASIIVRNDAKSVTEYKVTGGSVLHLVLALRGGH